MTARSEALFIGGRSGSGKSSVGYEIHAQLSAACIQHCLIEGDNLDMAWPPPWEHRLAERNLAAMWANYRALGYRKLIYTNTASVSGGVLSELTAAMGDGPRITAVLLTCSDATARQRIARREIGSELDRHIERSDLMARRLERCAPAWVHRVATDGRTVTDLTAEVIALTGWIDEYSGGLPGGGGPGPGAEGLGSALPENIAAIAANSHLGDHWPSATSARSPGQRHTPRADDSAKQGPVLDGAGRPPASDSTARGRLRPRADLNRATPRCRMQG